MSAPQIPIELYYLTKATLHQLTHGDINVVFTLGNLLGIENLSEAFNDFFRFFELVLSYIKSEFPFYWIIYAPPSLIRTPLNWPLIAHEIGHILERQKWKFVDEYYPYPAVSTATRQLYRPEHMKSRYAQEFQADVVALSYFGPVFASKLHAFHEAREFVVSPSHPSMSERFAAIADKLEEAGYSPEAVKLKAISEKEHPLISRGGIEYLDKILSKTAMVLKESSCVYTREDAKEKKAKRKLAQFVPYTDDVRILLNVANDALQSILQSTADTAEKRKLKSDFDDLLKDCIRLNYIKQLSTRF